MQENKVTAVIIVHNEKEFLPGCLNALGQAEEITNAIIIDNGSADGLSAWLKEQSYGYVIFDEGIQKYGKVVNTVIDNFETEEFILFMSPRYLLGRKTAGRMMKTIRDNPGTCIAGGKSNGFQHRQKEELQGIEDVYRLEKEDQKEDIYSLGLDDDFWMMRREEIKANGPLSEELSAPENVLLDYELKLLQKGYHHMISGTAYVFDVLQGVRDVDYEKETKTDDRKTLKRIWNMNYFNLTGNKLLVSLLDKTREDVFQVLEIGCDLGATLVEIKNQFPNSRTYGLEINPASVKIAEHVAEVKLGNIEEYQIPFKEKFDYIIFGDVLEHLQDPQRVIAYCREKLKDGGCIIASVPNLMHISVMQGLINGVFQYQDTGLLDRTHIHFFTYYEIVRMFQMEQYKLDDVRQSVMLLSSEQEELKNQLLKLSEQTKPFMYETFQYLVRARKE